MKSWERFSYLVDAGKMTAGFVLTYLVAPLITGFKLLVQGAASIVGALERIPVWAELFRERHKDCGFSPIR